MISRIVTDLTHRPQRWLIAGIAATVVLAIFMEGVARLVIGGPLKPAALICQVFGWNASLLWLGEILHYLLGVIAFPIGYVVMRGIIGGLPGIVSGAIWGILLWVAAGLILAPLAGTALFFGGGQVMIASLVAHLAYGLVLGAVFRPARATAA